MSAISSSAISGISFLTQGQLRNDVIKSSTPADMVWGGGFVRLESPSFALRV